MFRKEYGETSGEGVMVLEKIIKRYDDQDGTFIQSKTHADGNYSAVAVTPLMKSAGSPCYCTTHMYRK